MKKKKNSIAKIAIIITIIILAIIFAIVTSDYLKTKSKNKEMNIEKVNRNIIFAKTGKQKAYIEFNGNTENAGELSISDDGRNIIFTTPVFENLKDKATIHYWVTNNNSEDIKIGKLICKKTPNVETATDYISVTSNDELKDTILKSGKTSDREATIDIELIKSYTDASNLLVYTISCELTATTK